MPAAAEGDVAIRAKALSKLLQFLDPDAERDAHLLVCHARMFGHRVLGFVDRQTKCIESDYPAGALDRHPEIIAQDRGDIRRQAEVLDIRRSRR